ncbi:hypothetical protein [Microbacterium rhizophilus]|uniref:hypothetical protein n=1 Tax=Microbacterium rhizophilus TaxID=3138934 RepID=UPI0031E86A42
MVRQPSARAWTGIAVVAVLAVVVGALAVMAMQRVSAPPSSEPASDADGTAPPTPAQSALPTPVGSATAPAVVPREAERFLAAGVNGVLWRVTAGSCQLDIPPVLERSGDDGVTWADVTPAYRGITQVMSLEDFADVQAEAVATVLDDASAGDPCDPRAMRTFSDGSFWSDYPEVLAARSYLTPDGVLVTPGGETEAPCAEPRSVRSSGAVVALVCDGQVSWWDGATWTAEAVPASIAVAVGAEGLYIAHVDPECDGVQLSLVAPDEEPVAVVCETGLDPALPLALDATDAGSLWLWSGDEVRSSGSAVASAGAS